MNSRYLFVAAPPLKEHETTKGFPLIPLSNEDSEGEYYLDAQQEVEVIENAGDYRVSTRLYIYQLWDAPDHQLFSWHYHPEDPLSPVPYPHVHIYSAQRSQDAGLRLLHKEHIPSGRVSLEDVSMFLIKELGFSPQSKDWEKVIIESAHRCERNMTWGRRNERVFPYTE
ncbi:MAG: hypothetical protein AB7W16_23620 [Candidatus Obscuribacterales bacterium]